MFTLRFIRHIAAALPVAALLILSGCETVRPTALTVEVPQVKNELPVAGASLLDGFEGPEFTVWSFDSADDEAAGQYVSEGTTQGNKALKITLQKKGSKGRLQLRRDVPLNLSHASALLIDITAPADNLSVGMAFKCDPDDLYQESKTLSLKKGLNRDVRFALDESTWKNAASKWQNSAVPTNLDSVKRVIFFLYTGSESSGSFVVDNLRVEGVDFITPESAARAYREWRPEIVMLSPFPSALSQYDSVELQSVFRASYRDIFDSSDLSFGMRVTTPSGKSLDVRGFFGGVYHSKKLMQADEHAPLTPLWGPFEERKKKSKANTAGAKDEKKDEKKPAADVQPKAGTAANEAASVPGKRRRAKGPPTDGGGELSGDTADLVPVWQLRFTPQESGRYTTQVYVRNSAGETRMPERAFVVAPQSSSDSLPGRRGGNVRVAKRDAHQFEVQDGSPFYSFGENVCWTQDWDPYLDKIAAYGGNTCRIWLCPWGCSLERKGEPGSYDLKEAARLDRLIQKAESTGVRIIFCFTFHGATASVWADSPYNQANGGPCSRSQDFFTDPRAKRQFKRLLSYATARWGASPAILSWELMNEMDLASYDSPDDVGNWAREMAGYLKGADVHNHLVTTSVSNANFLPDIWQDGRIDFICVHPYSKDVTKSLYDHMAPFRGINKPLMFEEFGGGPEPGDDIPDQDGARLQAGLWYSACSPACGMPLPWWWDTYIEARNLYPVMAAAGRFIAGEDRRGRFSDYVHKPYEGGLEVTGIMDSQGARLYVHRPEWIRRPETRGAALIEAAVPLELTGMIDGTYKIEYWDAKEGKVFSTLEVPAESGKLNLQLPPRAGEFALKVDRKQRLVPGLK